MNTIDLKKYTTVTATGDCHGNFRALVNSVCVQHKLRDTLVIVCGDIGMGFYKRGYYTDEFKWMQKRLEEYGNCLAMFRGNHDNPVYFNSEEYSEFQEPGRGGKYKNVFLIEDYTVLQTIKGNILCIGGAVSIDRSARTAGISWWEDEKFCMPDELDYMEIGKSNVTIVATHTCPSCCGPMFSDAMGYEKFDRFLMSELQNERLDLLEVYENIKQSSDIKLWLYGHFHNHYQDDHIGTLFVGLDMIRPNSGGADIYEIRGEDNGKGKELATSEEPK
jgi:predicted phosphodiesterase